MGPFLIFLKPLLFTVLVLFGEKHVLESFCSFHLNFVRSCFVLSLFSRVYVSRDSKMPRSLAHSLPHSLASLVRSVARLLVHSAFSRHSRHKQLENSLRTVRELTKFRFHSKINSRTYKSLGGKNMLVGYFYHYYFSIARFKLWTFELVAQNHKSANS